MFLSDWRLWLELCSVSMKTKIEKIVKRSGTFENNLWFVVERIRRFVHLLDWLTSPPK